MSTKNATIRARVSQALKVETDQVFESLGITSAEAIRLFLTQVQLQRALPFTVPEPTPANNSDILRPATKRRAALDLCYDP